MAFAPLFSLATKRLSEITMIFERMCANQGSAIAAEWSLTNWYRDLAVRGADLIPAEGSLRVSSSHPGPHNILIIASRWKRDDLRIFVSDIQSHMGLPNASRYCIFLNLDPKERLTKTRDTV